MNVQQVIVDGQKQGRRSLVVVDGQPVRLPGVRFRFMVLLALAAEEGEGWVSNEALWFQPEIVSRYMHVMKQDIHSQAPGLKDWPVVENNFHGSYRLLANSVQIVSYRLFNSEFADIREAVGVHG